MRRKKSSLLEKRDYFGYLFIAPLIIGVALIFIPNLVKLFQYSISEIDAANGFSLSFKGFGMYKTAFTEDPEFIPLLIGDLQPLLTQMPVILIYSLFISTILNQKFVGRTAARLVFFVPVILASGVITMVDGDAMYYAGVGQAIDAGEQSVSYLSEVNQLLASLNLPKVLIETVTGAVSNIYSVTRSSGLQIFIFLAGLQEIPSSLYEAASVEGCNKWELFWKITFPMISPQIVINMVYTISSLAVENSRVLSYSEAIAFNQSNYPLGSAMNIVYLASFGLLIAVMMLIVRKLTPKIA